MTDPARPSHDALFEDPTEPPLSSRAWGTPRPAGPAPRPVARPDGDRDDSAPRSPSPVPPAPVRSPGTADQDASVVVVAGRPTGVPVPTPLAPSAPPADAGAGPAVDDPAPIPVAAAKPVDTGRLFRSSGAEGPAATSAIPALNPGWLRTDGPDPVGLPSRGPDGSDPLAEADAAGLPAAASAAPAADPVVDLAKGPAGQPAPAGAPVIIGMPPGLQVPAPDPEAGGTAVGGPVVGGPVVGDPTAAAPQRGLTAGAVWGLVVGVTVLAGLADGLLHRSTGLGWITGVALVASTLVAALTVRRDDLWVAVIVPPLAFLAATVTAGQLTLPPGQGLPVREGLMIFTTLSVNAPWMLGATALALVIVLVRRFLFGRPGSRRSRRSA